MKGIKYIILALAVVGSAVATRGQSTQYAPEEEPSAGILMRGEVHTDKVLLRWVPTDARTWKRLNEHGVMLERLTLVRNGQVLDEPEVRQLGGPMKPEESEEFMRVAEQYSYAAIIAQAVFGESFVISSAEEGGIETIIALSDELQQRFALSLYAADLCFPAAVAAGWGFEDLTINKNEKYLYRVIPLVPEDGTPISHGALFVDTEEIDHFPAPLDFAGQFMDSSVLLSWNARIQQDLYAAYIPERSTDGKNFMPITETPITRMDASDSNERIFYADSIANYTTYHYRLVGLTPFGTRSEISDTIQGIGRPELRTPPFITRAIPDMNGGALIEWEFAPENEELIEHFTLERSDNDRDFVDHITPIDKTRRSLSVPDLASTNYFAITANSLTGKRLRSFTALVQPVDTLPPATPVGLIAIADTTGVVRLSWQANRDKGRFGYRIYRAQTAEEELIPLNDIAHRDTIFIDSINLRTLNRNIYYAITALDERYNQSDKTPTVEVKRPEVIPPTPPFIRQIDVENGRNIVRWVSGSESTLAGYDLYRQIDREGEFDLLAMIPAPEICEYEDGDIENNRTYTYRVLSRSEGGLLSDPSPDYRVTAVSKSAAKIPITFKLTPAMETIKLSWNIPITDVVNVQLYKKTDAGGFTLMGEGLESVGESEDRDVIPGFTYQYMLVVKSNSAPPATIVKSLAL